jgi:hypothetical protein
MSCREKFAGDEAPGEVLALGSDPELVSVMLPA